jgi:uncharacterized protein (DUF305 family)
MAAALALGVIVPGASAQVTRTAQAKPAAGTQAKRGPDYTKADVEFMQGMMGHHAQAIVMANMAPTHASNAQVKLFCQKVLRSQRDEIELMSEWLKDRGETVPDTSAMAHGDMKMDMDMDMGGKPMLMPGMLTPEQMAELGRAQGTAWDTLFLKDMIQHHTGALTMVATLFDSPGAGQQPEIFGYATGVDNDQRAEIGRMQGMLTTITGRTSK